MQSVSNVDLRLLRLFSTIVECGGFAGAQSKLNLTASTVSTHMSALEQRLGLRLCERGRVGFRLTDNGKEVYEAAKRLLGAVDTFSADASALRGHLAGNLAVGSIDNTVTDNFAPLPRALQRFVARGGDVRLHVVIDPPPELERAVLDGRLMLAIGPFTGRISSLTYRPLYTEKQVLYCAPGHPLYEVPESEQTIKAIAEAEFVARGYIETQFPRSLKNVRETATAFNVEAQVALILSGRYIGYLPEHYAALWVRDGRLKPLMPKKLAYRTRLSLVTRRGTEPNLVVRTLLEDLDHALTELPAEARLDFRPGKTPLQTDVRPKAPPHPFNSSTENELQLASRRVR